MVTLLLGSAAAAGCADTGKQTSGSVQPQGQTLKLTLGTKDFTESVLIGELYSQALTANGYQVVLRKNVGPTEEIDQALEDGDIDAYPEYLGVAATVLAGEDAEGLSEAETSKAARDFYAARDQSVSEETPFEDVDAIATTFLFAQQNQLRSIADLRELDSFTLGARAEFEGREQGFAGMQSVYGLTNATFKSIDFDARYNALFEKDVDVANVFSTDGQLDTGDFRLLEDPERLFGYQHVALVIDDTALDSLGGDAFMRVIDNVNSQLSQKTMIELNSSVDLDGRDPAAVAERFLRDNGLLSAVGG